MGFKNDTNFSGWGWWFYIICVNGREQLPPCNWTQLLSFHLWKASLWSNCSAKDEGAHFAVSRIGMWYDGPSDVSSLSSPLSFLMGVRSWASICRSLWSVIFCGVGEGQEMLNVCSWVWIGAGSERRNRKWLQCIFEGTEGDIRLMGNGLIDICSIIPWQWMKTVPVFTGTWGAPLLVQWRSWRPAMSPEQRQAAKSKACWRLSFK